MFKSLFSNKKDHFSRKERTEKLLKKLGIKINAHLPDIESDEQTTLRSPKEVAIRVTILAVTSLVAFGHFTGERAIEYLKDHNLYQYLTPDEHDFLLNPQPELKNQVSWKCECIWVLLWSLNIVEDLGFPDQLCDLNDIAESDYPLNGDEDPNNFINRDWKIRPKSEILDAADLYYRVNWACVDARLNGQNLNKVNSGVVYERQYALNWLINYMNQEWDDITCDT